MTKLLDTGSHSKSLIGAAVTAASKATTGTIKNETGEDATIVALDLMSYPTLETVVNSGGLVNMTIDSLDIKPCDLYVGGVTAVDAGGVDLEPERHLCHIPFPKDSTLTVEYTPKDNQSQKLAVIVHFENSIIFDPSKRTYFKSGEGAALTQVTVAAANISITCPAGKGGYIQEILAWAFGIQETVVNSGGLIALSNESHHYEPLEFLTNGNTCITEGGGKIKAARCQKCVPYKSTSIVKAAVTPQDNQSTIYAMTLKWTPSLA